MLSMCLVPLFGPFAHAGQFFLVVILLLRISLALPRKAQQFLGTAGLAAQCAQYHPGVHPHHLPPCSLAPPQADQKSAYLPPCHFVKKHSAVHTALAYNYLVQFEGA